MENLDEMYHNCRWCKHNVSNKCVKMGKVFESTGSSKVYQMAEDGRLFEAIEESLTKSKFDYLKDLLQEYGISNKRYKEILKTIEEDLDMNKNNLIEDIDEGVSRLLLNNEVDSVNELELIDPENFYCKYFE